MGPVELERKHDAGTKKKKDNFQTIQKRIQRDFAASLMQLGSTHQRGVQNRKQPWTLVFQDKYLVLQKTTGSTVSVPNQLSK